LDRFSRRLALQNDKKRKNLIMSVKEEHKVIGRVVATEKRPNTAQSFSFWTNLDSPVGIGTIVKIESDRIYTDKKTKEEYKRTI